MYYSIDTKTGSITGIDSKKTKEPFTQYTQNVTEDKILLSISGKNKLAKQLQKIIVIHIFDMNTKSNIRRMHLIIEIGINRFVKFKTNMDVLPSDALLKELLPSLPPEAFLKILSDTEKTYAENTEIEHTPWLEGFFAKQNENAILKTWGAVRGKTPQMFNDYKNDID